MPRYGDGWREGSFVDADQPVQLGARLEVFSNSSQSVHPVSRYAQPAVPDQPVPGEEVEVSR